jgi:prepilin-type N-terminal cleavage/methylation domain-containing protein
MMSDRIRPFLRVPASRPAGFTLIEIILALGIFALGIVYVFALFDQATRTTEKARQQVIVSILYQDIKSKQQAAAVMAVAGGVDTFHERNNGWSTDGSPVGMHGYGGNWLLTRGAYDDLTPDVDEYNNDDWSLGSDGKRDFRYQDVAIYYGFMFNIESADMTPKEADQFVDFDGYIATDKDGYPIAGITEEEANYDFDGDGIIDDKANYDFGEPAPTAGAEVTFLPAGMRHYMHRFKCIIAFDYEMRDDGADPPGMFSSNEFLQVTNCQHAIFYFDIYNPDTDKDTTGL